MKSVTLVENILDPSTWVYAEVEDLFTFLSSKFDKFPESARIYQGSVSTQTDITPTTEEDVNNLGILPGPFFVIVYPEGQLVVPLIIAAVSIAASLAINYLLKPSLPGAPKEVANSPNNELSNRSNNARPLGRIPDIFGTVRAIPDLLTFPYRTFINNEEIEYTYMCLGRGEYDVNDIKEGDTLFSTIIGSSLAIYGPNTSPNFGAPQVTVGSPITEPLTKVVPTKGVDGLTILFPESGHFVGGNDPNFDNIKLVATSPTDLRLEIPSAQGSYLTDVFAVGDTVRMDGTVNGYGAVPTGGVYNGYYRIKSVTAFSMSFETYTPDTSLWVAVINAGSLTTAAGFAVGSLYHAPTGPYAVQLVAGGAIQFNFVEPSGLYVLDPATGNQGYYPCSLVVHLQQFDYTTGNNIGIEWQYVVDIPGSSITRAALGQTVKFTKDIYGNPLPVGWYKASVHCVSAEHGIFVGYGEIHWKDLYSLVPITQQHFGDVTTVYVESRCPRGIILPKERKLNMLATRKVLIRGAGPLTPSNRVDDIFTHICLDSRIGRRTVAEVDINGIYDTIALVQNYFGTQLAIEFNGTLDKDKISFEETATVVADAAFCVAYRKGGLIRLKFESTINSSVILFNHRNKVPGSETRTVRFGNQDDYDGVEYQYTDSSNMDGTGDVVATLYLPSDMSAVNPQKIEAVGIRNKLQAYFHANRNWNKIKYKTTAVEFEGLEEAGILVPTDRILVADNTRPETWDGDILYQNGLVLTLSQSFTRMANKLYTVFLQLTDGTIQSLPVTTLVGPNIPTDQVVLGTSPRLPLVVDPILNIRTTYQIIANDDPREHTFLLTEIEPQSKLTHIIRAVNYDSRYYSKDKDYINHIVGSDGNNI